MAKTKKFPRGKINKKWKWIVVSNLYNITLYENKPEFNGYEVIGAGDMKYLPELFSGALLDGIDLTNYQGLYEIED